MRASHVLVTRIAAVVVAFGVCLGIAACSTGGQESGLPPYTGVTPNPNDVAPDDTDYSVDAGNAQVEYEYEAGPASADSVLATLCNLNQTFFSGLRTLEGGAPVVDDTLRTNMVGLADLIYDWESLRFEVSEAATDIDLATQIHEHWDLALLGYDNGDMRTVQAEMAEAERLLGELPREPSDYCVSR